MECACVYVGIDEYSEEISSEQLVATRKCVCNECHGSIETDTKYCKEVVKFDGQISTQRTCLDCLSIRDVFFCNGWYWDALLEYLAEHIRDCNGDISEDCLVELTPRARARVCRMIEECWRTLDDK